MKTKTTQNKSREVQFGIGYIKKMSGIVCNSKEDANQDKLFGQTIICALTFVDCVDIDGKLLALSYTQAMGGDWLETSIDS